jgi:hypothetical protein
MTSHHSSSPGEVTKAAIEREGMPCISTPAFYRSAATI